MGRYVALLRGINVGGKNLIKMAALSACFEKHGYEDVVTYIQSGNVLFTSRGSARAELIEEVLATTFGYQASVVLRSRKQMQDVVARAPRGFGEEPEKYRYDVVFLKEPLTAATALARVSTKPGVDQVFAGAGVLYLSRLIAKASQSRLSKLGSSPIYSSVTIRNWNTTTALCRMLDES